MTFENLYDSLEIGQLAIALFYGPSCAPCAALKPKLRKACADLEIRLEEFNTANEMEAVRLMGLRTVPAVVLVRRGGIARVLFTGDQPEHAVRLQLVAHGIPIPNAPDSLPA